MSLLPTIVQKNIYKGWSSAVVFKYYDIHTDEVRRCQTFCDPKDVAVFKKYFSNISPVETFDYLDYETQARIIKNEQARNKNE